MSISSLNIALSGLKAAQKGLDVTSNNIANASTPGYTRKILPQSTAMSGTGPVGVQVDDIIRSINMTLLRDLFHQSSAVSSFETRERFLSQIQAFHGSSDSETSISAQLGDLKNSFQQLADSPNDPLKINNVLAEAQFTVQKFNDLAALVTQLRNDAQNEAAGVVSDVNSLLRTLASLNNSIKTQTVNGRSAADLEDQRDYIVQQISEKIDVTFYKNSENILVLQTRQGEILADQDARQLVFNATTIGAESYYPATAAGLYIDSSVTGVNLTEVDIGGQLGALMNLRDEVLPRYGAQLDELAQKLASRFNAVGLRLFTDDDGTVPADTAPPAAPAYVGFASRMQINSNIQGNPDLLRTGTTGDTISAGSNEVIRRVVDFTFGAYAMQRATGNVDISAGTIFAATGMTASTQVVGDRNIASLATLDADPDIVGGAQFSIDAGGGAQLITINPGDTANDLVNAINAAIGPGTASLNGNGFIVLSATDDITIADVTLGADGIDALGLSFGTTTATNPAFTVQVGNATPVSVSIEPADTSVELLAKLNAIPGLTASLTVDGYLQLTPDRGGDLKVTDVSGSPAYGFLGVTISNVAHSSFRQTNVSPSGALSTGLVSIQGLEEFSRAMVSYQSEQHRAAKTSFESESNFKTTLQKQLLDETGVDIDTEVARLIELQTAYKAAARMISASEQLFDSLINSF